MESFFEEGDGVGYAGSEENFILFVLEGIVEGEVVET